MQTINKDTERISFRIHTIYQMPQNDKKDSQRLHIIEAQNTIFHDYNLLNMIAIFRDKDPIIESRINFGENNKTSLEVNEW